MKDQEKETATEEAAFRAMLPSTLETMERLGLIRIVGYRDGLPAYAITDKGRRSLDTKET
jgi:hypothetical protein